MQKQEKIYIIGAGISGLIAAYELEKEGYLPVILEKGNEVGGRVKTLYEKGFTLDLGFQVLLNAYPLAKQYLDMDALQLQHLSSGAFIYSNGNSYQIGDPSRNIKLLLPTLLAQIGSLRDKLKILKLNRRLKAKSIEEIFQEKEKTTYDYLVDFGFSTQIIDTFFKPFFAGIFLEVELSTSSRMFEFVYKMFGEGEATIPRLGIGEISRQLQAKLKQTEFRFNSPVDSVDDNQLRLQNGEIIFHEGVIISANAAPLINNLTNQDIRWKSCMCLYFEVDQTNIPDKTIALIADKDKYANNLYAYKDPQTGKQVLSVTSLNYKEESDEEITQKISHELRTYIGCSQIDHIHSYRIDQALPDIQNLKMSSQASETQVMDHVFLAGDYLLNGSLNAAMESGRLAASGLIEKKKGIFS